MTMRAGILMLLLTLLPACGAPGEPSSPPAARIPERSKEQNAELGRQHKTAFELYQALREEAGGGQPLNWNALPD